MWPVVVAAAAAAGGFAVAAGVGCREAGSDGAVGWVLHWSRDCRVAPALVCTPVAVGALCIVESRSPVRRRLWSELQ